MRQVLTVLAVRDLECSTRFYAQAFGWPQPVAAPVYSEFALDGGLRLGLYLRTGFALNVGQLPTEIPTNQLAPAELYFHCNDVEVDIRRLMAAGARELSALAARDWGDDAAYFADPDGHVLVLARPSPRC